jgi:hypothetical protein
MFWKGSTREVIANEGKRRGDLVERHFQHGAAEHPHGRLVGPRYATGAFSFNLLRSPAGNPRPKCSGHASPATAFALAAGLSDLLARGCESHGDRAKFERGLACNALFACGQFHHRHAEPRGGGHALVSTAKRAVHQPILTIADDQAVTRFGHGFQDFVNVALAIQDMDQSRLPGFGQPVSGHPGARDAVEPLDAFLVFEEVRLVIVAARFERPGPVPLVENAEGNAVDSHGESAVQMKPLALARSADGAESGGVRERGKVQRGGVVNGANDGQSPAVVGRDRGQRFEEVGGGDAFILEEAVGAFGGLGGATDLGNAVEGVCGRRCPPC